MDLLLGTLSLPNYRHVHQHSHSDKKEDFAQKVTMKGPLRGRSFPYGLALELAMVKLY